MYHFDVRANLVMADAVCVFLRLPVRGWRGKFFFLIYAFPCLVGPDVAGVFIHGGLP
jgi:hypothetical protein